MNPSGWVAFSWSGIERADLERLAEQVQPRWWLVYWADRFALGTGPPQDLDRSVAGSAFGDGGELRWRLDDGELRAVMLAPTDHRAVSASTTLVGLQAGDEVGWIVAGRWNGHDYVDGSFSKPFDYPRQIGDDTPMPGDRLELHAVPLTEDGRPAFHALRGVRIAAGSIDGQGEMP